MTQPTHTHKTQGGRFALIALHHGTGALDGQLLAFYRDLDREVDSVALEGEWRQHWRGIEKDDCSVCLGTGKDAIKGNREHPCGGCYGLGRVRKDGETPDDRWELADVALGIIQRQQQELGQLRQVAALPEVQAIVKKRQQQAGPPDWVQKEQAWREGSGRGHGGRRHVGD